MSDYKNYLRDLFFVCTNINEKARERINMHSKSVTVSDFDGRVCSINREEEDGGEWFCWLVDGMLRKKAETIEKKNTITTHCCY